MATFTTEGELRDWFGSVTMPAAAATLDGFRAWACSGDFPDKGRISYINDEILLEMSPEELETNVKVKTVIAAVLHQLVDSAGLGTIFGDGTLVSNVVANLATEPDCTFVSYDNFKSGRTRVEARKDRPGQFMEIVGSPDWVLEVVSRSSVRKDTRLLKAAYHAAGVGEYWLINAMGDEIDFQILHHEPNGFAAAAEEQGWRESRAFGRQFQLKRERDPVGMWRYTLLVQ